MSALNVVVNEFFKILQGAKSSVLVRTLLGALALSQILVNTGWPEDYKVKGKYLLRLR